MGDQWERRIEEIREGQEVGRPVEGSIMEWGKERQGEGERKRGRRGEEGKENSTLPSERSSVDQEIELTRGGAGYCKISSAKSRSQPEVVQKKLVPFLPMAVIISISKVHSASGGEGTKDPTEVTLFGVCTPVPVTNSLRSEGW